MNPPDGYCRDICHFLEVNSLLSLATSFGSDQHICTVFYALYHNPFCLIFKSELQTLHMEHIRKNPTVVAAVASANDPPDINSIEGVQIKGIVAGFSNTIYTEAEKCYNHHFHFAELVSSKIYAVVPMEIKHTINRKVFGHKEVWRNPMKDMAGLEMRWPFYND